MIKELHDGLILRSLSEGVQSDFDNLAQFYVDVFKDNDDENADEIYPMTQDLLSDKHPTMSLDDVWVVVNPAENDRIVSALLLIPQTWRYDEVEFGVGRVELVATHKDYRRRGLIRKLMDVAHERSAELGHLVQGITGIGHYYRRFGYAMAVNLGADAQLPLSSIPEIKDGEQLKFTLRPAITNDITNLQAWEAYEQHQGGLTVKRDWEDWNFDINHRQPDSTHAVTTYIVVNADGQDMGFVSLDMSKYFRKIDIWQYIIGEQSSYFDTFHDVMRSIKAMAGEFYATLPEEKHPIKIRFENGVSPAIKSLIRSTDGGLLRKYSYVWYLRVESLPAFIKHIAPVLERRLQGSGMNRFTGEVAIDFYNLSAIKISFRDGCIDDIVNINVKPYESDAALPYDTFLNILFGHRDIREIAHILPEAYANQKADLLFSILFPLMRTQLGEGIG